MRIPFSDEKKSILIELFGGCCALCGDTYMVSVHHIDNHTDYSDCILNGIPLCTGKFNCHKNLHAIEIQQKLISMVYRKINKNLLSKEDLIFYYGHTRNNSIES